MRQQIPRAPKPWVVYFKEESNTSFEQNHWVTRVKREEVDPSEEEQNQGLRLNHELSYAFDVTNMPPHVCQCAKSSNFASACVPCSN